MPIKQSKKVDVMRPFGGGPLTLVELILGRGKPVSKKIKLEIREGKPCHANDHPK